MAASSSNFGALAVAGEITDGGLDQALLSERTDDELLEGNTRGG